MRILGIIPSRLQSSRIKEKPIYNVCGMPLIEHVFRRARMCKQLDKIVVATDSVQIKKIIESVNGECMMTSKHHKNGTERMSEVVKEYGDYDYYVLINGDEILLNPESINVSIEALRRSPSAAASILAVKYTKFNSPSDFKIVLNNKKEVMYISRNDIPFNSKEKLGHVLKAYHLMTFTKDTILKYSNLKKTSLENMEDHEHLRLLENGLKIVAETVDDDSISMDTEADIEIIQKKLKKDKIFKNIMKEKRKENEN